MHLINAMCSSSSWMENIHRKSANCVWMFFSLHSSNYQWRWRKGLLFKSICHPDKLASYSRPPVMKNIVLLISVQNFCLSMCCSTRVPSLKIRCWWCLFSIFQRLMFVSNHSNCSGQSWIFEWMRLTPSKEVTNKRVVSKLNSLFIVYSSLTHTTVYISFNGWWIYIYF